MVKGVNCKKEEGTPIPVGRRWTPQRVVWKCSTAEWPGHMKDGSHPMKSRAPDNRARLQRDVNAGGHKAGETMQVSASFRVRPELRARSIATVSMC